MSFSLIIVLVGTRTTIFLDIKWVLQKIYALTTRCSAKLMDKKGPSQSTFANNVHLCYQNITCTTRSGRFAGNNPQSYGVT